MYLHFFIHVFRQTLQKERQARELAEKEKNELLEKLNRLEEEATKARDGKTLFVVSLIVVVVVGVR